MSEETQVDHQIASSVFAINLVSWPPASVRDSMLKLQSAVEAVVPSGAVHRAPEDSLHMSIFQLVWARGNSSNSEAAWQVRQSEIVSELQAMASGPWNIVLAAPRLEVRTAAIILVFPPSSGIEALRHRLEAVPALAGLDSHRPSLQHVSLFRFTKQVPLNSLQSTCRDIEVDVPPWHMIEVDLVREMVYPSLVLEPLRTFQLEQNSAIDRHYN